MTHMEALGRLLTRPNSPAANVGWFFLVTDRTFVDVNALLRLLPPLDSSRKAYYGAIADTAHKEAFGFHDYVDLHMGVLLSSTLLLRIVDVTECHDQKSAGGTFDMFDAKLGNCVYYTDQKTSSERTTPKPLDGFVESDPPVGCTPGGGVNGIVSYGKVEPQQMIHLSQCASLISTGTAKRVLSEANAHEHADLRIGHIGVHVMARETKLNEVIASCESTWAGDFPFVYYHADRGVASSMGYSLSKGKYAVSKNLAKDSSNGDGYGGGASNRVARIAALNLPERPGGGGEHWKISHDKGMGWNTWLRFKMRAIFEWSIKAPWNELKEVRWLVYVDDDTYVIRPTLLSLLRRYDSNEAHYFGRPLQEEGYPAFVGGGAGIVLSRGGANTILGVSAAHDECSPLHLKWNDRIHQGGDAWLGDCAEVAGVHTEMEYGFYPQPPVADLFHLYSDAVAFHGVEDHKAFHTSRIAFNAQNMSVRHALKAKTDPRCVPVFVDHKYTCLPHFIIGGVPKAGTTSLYKYLLQHPEVLPAKDKELTFWGNFFSPKRRPGREEVTTEYLDKFPYISPSDFKVTGEATPGYLYCLTCPTYILKYIPKVKLLFTLRNPIVRAYSEYLNKRVDRTVMRYLHKRIDNKMDKELSDKAPPFYRLVAEVARTMSTCKMPNRTYSMMDEYDQELADDRCYVNPFVAEGRYARYLKNYLATIPRRQLLLLNFDEWTTDAEGTMRVVFNFLQLKPFPGLQIQEAHNTHLSRSVHVNLAGASNLSDIGNNQVGDTLSYKTHCILHEFYSPYQVELDALLKQHGYAPMRWDTASKGGKACPTAYRHWPKSVERWGRGSSSREEEEVEESAAADGGDDGGG